MFVGEPPQTRWGWRQLTKSHDVGDPDTHQVSTGKRVFPTHFFGSTIEHAPPRAPTGTAPSAPKKNRRPQGWRRRPLEEMRLAWTAEYVRGMGFLIDIGCSPPRRAGFADRNIESALHQSRCHEALDGEPPEASSAIRNFSASAARAASISPTL